MEGPRRAPGIGAPGLTVRRYEAVLFDAGETLLHVEPSFPAALAALLTEHGHDVASRSHEDFEQAARGAFRAALDRAEPFSTSAVASRRFWVGVYAAIFEAFAIEDPRGLLANRIYEELSRPERYALFPDAMPALEALRARGFRLGIVSNWEAWLERLLELRGLSPIMEVTVISGAVGIEKPDRRIFRLALDRLGLPPERVLYVGDTPKADVEPAVALGMGALLIDRRGRHAGPHCIRSLEEISRLIGAPVAP